MSITEWDTKWRPFGYNVGKAAWRLLEPRDGFTHTMTEKVQKILTTLRAAYLADIPQGSKAVIADAELGRLGKMIAQLTQEKREACVREVMSILNRTENDPMAKVKKGGRAKTELTTDVRAKIKQFLEKNKDLAYSKIMKAASAAGFSPGHVKIVKKEVGHRTKDTWAAAAGKATKKAATAKKPATAKKKVAPKAAVKKKKPAKKAAKKKAAPAVTLVATKEPKKKKVPPPVVVAPAETKPAGPQETKPAAAPQEVKGAGTSMSSLKHVA
jgi:hypothetical protein